MSELWPRDGNYPQTARVRTHAFWLVTLFSAWVSVIAFVRVGPTGMVGTGRMVLGGLTAIIAAVWVGVCLMWMARWPTLSVATSGWACLVGLLVSADPIVPASLLQLTMIGAVVQLRPHRSLGAVGMVAGAYLACVPLARSGAGLLPAIDDVTIQAALAVASRAIAVQLSRNAQRLDDLGRELLAAEVEASMSKAELAATSGLRAALHDHVAYALTLVARQDVDGVARTACREAAEALERVQGEVAPSPATVGTILARVRRASSVTLDLRVDTGVDQDRLDPAMGQAVLRGILEALRNVRKHTSEEAASLTCVRSEQAVTFEVRDGGRGTLGQPGWGVKNSIIAPIDSLGGNVTVSTQPGQGTCVRFIVPLRAQAVSRFEAAHRETIEALGDFDPVVAAGIAVLGADTWLGVRYSLNDRHWVGQLAILLVVVLATLALARMLRHRAPTPTLIVVWAAGAIACISAGLTLAEPDSLLNYNSWVIGTVTVSACMLAAVTPRPVGLLIAGAMGATTLAAAVRSPVPVSSPVGAYGAAVFAVLVTVLLTHWQRGRLAEARQIQQQIASVSRQVQFRRSVAASTSGQDALVKDRLIPALTAWAEQRVPPQAHLAELLYAEVRDELAITGRLDEPLRRRIRDARSAGLDLQLVPPDGEPTAVSATLRVLDRVLDQAGSLRKAVLWFPTSEEPTVRLLVSPGLDKARVATLVAPLSDYPLTTLNTPLGTDLRIALHSGSGS